MHTITIEGPGKNALSSALMTSLRARIEAAGQSPILLTGAGDAFSAGLDLKEVVSLDLEGMAHFLGLLQKLVLALYSHPAPTCAIVNGHAIAGGCILALCCDLRVARPNPGTRIGLNEVAIGLRFPPSLLRKIATRVPPQHLEEVVLGAGLHPPEEALRLGMIDAVEEDADAWAHKALARRARHPPAAYTSAKLSLRQEGLFEVEDEDQRFLDEDLQSWASPELKAHLNAILKR